MTGMSILDWLIIWYGQSLSKGKDSGGFRAVVGEPLAHALRAITSTGNLVPMGADATGEQEPCISFTNRIAAAAAFISDNIISGSWGVGGKKIEELSKGWATNPSSPGYDPGESPADRAKRDWYGLMIAGVRGAQSAIAARSEVLKLLLLMAFVHGEANLASGMSIADYKAYLYRLIADIRADLADIDGVASAPVILSQVATWVYRGGVPTINLAQLQVADEDPLVIMSGPQYQFTYAYPANPSASALHLDALGYRMLGDQIARALLTWVLTGVFEPLRPIKNGYVVLADRVLVKYSGNNGNIRFKTDLPFGAAPNMGFSLHNTGATIAPGGVQITAADTITIFTSGSVGAGALLGYGTSVNDGVKGIGNVCDSDPLTSGFAPDQQVENPKFAMQTLDPLPAPSDGGGGGGAATYTEVIDFWTVDANGGLYPFEFVGT